MARASREQAEKHRQQIVEAASRLFRERGLDGVSVPELMGAAGMTHGGFYGHFESKDALAALAAEAGFGEFSSRFSAAVARHPADAQGARRDVLENYLSPGHRDHPGQGCATAALSVDVARSAPDSPIRETYATAINRFVDEVAAISPHSPGDEAAARDDALATVATMVGALIIARASKGDPISDAVLDAALRRLLAESGSGDSSFNA